MICKKCRAPHGARGLKSIGTNTKEVNQWSRPAWGAWIEIKSDFFQIQAGLRVAPRTGRGE